MFLGPGPGCHFSLICTAGCLWMRYTLFSIKSQGSYFLLLILENLVIDLDAQTFSPVMNIKY